MKIWGNGSDKPLSAKTWNGLIVNSSVTLNTYLLSFYQLHILIYILIFTTNILKKIFKKVFNKRFKKKVHLFIAIINYAHILFEHSIYQQGLE